MQDLFTNSVFAGGIGLIGFTAAMALGKQAFVKGIDWGKRRLLVSLEVPSRDMSYSWLLKWMETQKTRYHQLSVDTSFIKRENGSSKTTFSLLPGQGRHFLKYTGAWFMIERQRATKMIDITNGSPWETITFTTLSRDRNLLYKLLNDAHDNALKSNQGKTVILKSFGHEWRRVGEPRVKKKLSSVVLDGEISEMLVKDVENFLNGSSWYYDRGIPYRRGYLLYGPPGSGKTSFVLALAGQLDYNICVLSLSDSGMTDDRLNHLLTQVPPRSLILLEDIDAAFNHRSVNESQQGYQYQSRVTFSGLLNAFDGVTSSEERIIFMTTNHLDRLDPALIRPGRVDIRVLIDNATPSQAKRLFLKFYQNQYDLAEEFEKNLRIMDPDRTVSAAQLQGHFVVYKDSASDAVKNLSDLLLEKSSAQSAAN